MGYTKNSGIVSPGNTCHETGNGKSAIRTLLIQLEFPNWKAAKSWGYAGHFGLEEGFHANNVETFILPAWGMLLAPDSPFSWLSYAKELCQNQHFDQVWLWLVHCEYPQSFLEWVSTLAPIRVGCLYESLTYTREECLHNPKFETRREEVFRQMQGLTHVICSDECDASYIQEQGIAKAIWSPTFIPSRFVSQEYVSPANSMAAFFGSPYSEERRRWLQEAKLSSLLARPSSPEDAAGYPLQFDRLHQTTLDHFKRRLPITGEILGAYVDELRSVRKGAFAAWMNGLSQWNGIVNLPSFGKVYTSRIAEAMAAGSPAISWEVPNRPRNKALFEEGKEILLYQRNQPEQLAQILLDLQKNPGLAKTVVGHAREKINRYHTAEIRVSQILHWIETGTEPEYGENSVREKPGDYADIGSNGSIMKRLSMLSDPQEGRNVSKFLPKGYIERVGHTQYLDAPGDLIYQPHVYALAGFLAERAGVQWIVDIGCGSGEKLQALSKQFRILGIDCSAALNHAKDTLSQGRFIEFDLENGLPQLSEEILRDSVVICSDVIEHIKQPERLMQALASLSRVAPFVLVSTPDRDRARGWLDNGPPANPAHVMEWAATEFSRFMKEAGFGDVPFLGHTINTDFHLAKTTTLAMAGTHAMRSSSTTEKFRVAAIIHAYNEVDILPEVVEHLFHEGIEVHVFDNWSTDGTWEIIGSLKASGIVSHAERFPEAPTTEYQWKRQLEKTEAYATTLDVDWVMHHDADEIRMSPWRGVTLKNAIARIHDLGYNAVDHTVIDFRFLSNRPLGKAPYQNNLTHFEFGRRPGHFQQIKAWKNVGNIQLSNTGGHEAQFPGRRIYPIKFLMKHYPLRNFDQAKQKVFQDRLPRVINEHKTLGWHSQYDQFSQEAMKGWVSKDVLPYHPTHFETEYLVERISGIGLEEKEPEIMEDNGLETRTSILKDYTRDVTTNVWQRQEYKGIAYNDGDEVERRLQHIVQNAADLSVMSVELIGHCTDWPSRYHLSSQRANLLRPFEEQLVGKQILEIGAGCGAITRYLGEIGAEVLALEGSPRRASIAALRCREQENVTLVAEAIHEFPTVPQFDVVTLIGVLEYARKFFPGEGRDPVDAMLKYVTGFLKPGGRLIIAIENQLGLKYFAGFPEDHMDQPMFGIEEHYDSNNVVTFGRKDLGERVRMAGLTESQWWYPFPDYKLPSLMVSERGALPADDMDLFPLVRHACSQDPQYPSRVSFNQGRAWRPIMRNGLLKDMANSFVLVASDTEILETPDKPVALHYATTRRPEFAKKVLFSRTSDGIPMTQQIALCPQAIPPHNSMVKLHLEPQAFIQGQLWQDRLVDIMTRSGWIFEEIQQWFRVWLEAFYSAAGLASTSNLMEEKIPGTFVDMTPRNLIVDQDGACKFFDQEWEYVEPIQVGYMVFRALMTSIGEMKHVSHPFDQTNSQLLHLIIKLAASVGFNFSTQQIKAYMAFEHTFQKCVLGVDFLSYKALYSVEETEAGAALPKASLSKKTSRQSDFDCSIVIPVFNKLELTKQCLTHLAEVTTGITYEVVVVDNHSSDGTGDFLQSLDGDIQIIRNATNLGFAKACNQGARAAKGKHLLFLNNDTIPQANWLAPLIQEFEEHEDVGIVGSKLLYPDKTIQHAGVVFSRNQGMPYHFLRGAPGELSIVNERKEFQAVTAACMLVRKDLFEQVGGFDEGYINGFEDVDLCLKVNAAGKKIIYQPKSWLYHLESQSPGRKVHDEENARRLMQQWEHQWLGDEDCMSFDIGYAIKHCVPDGKIKPELEPFADLAEQGQWQRVRDVQALLLRKEKSSWIDAPESETLHRLLGEIDLWPSDFDVLAWAGCVCQTLKWEVDAQRFWKKVLAIIEHSKARSELASSAIKAGDFVEAQQHLDVIRERFPKNVDGFTLQGIVYMQSQKFREALQEFEQAITLDSGNLKAQIGLGQAYLGLEQYLKAWETFERSVLSAPDDLRPLNGLIQAGTALQYWEALGNHLARYIERNPTDGDMRFALAGVKFRGGDMEKANEQFTWLRLLQPEFEGLENLERLLQSPQPQGKVVSTR